MTNPMPNPMPNPRHCADIRIHTQADLERTWRQMMEPLGFGGTTLWVMPIAPTGEIGHLVEIVEADGPPDAEMLANLARMLRDLEQQISPGARWAFLRSRPGRAGASSLDRAWARGLTDATRAVGLTTEVVHLATDVDLVPLPDDDLPAAG